MKVKRLVIAVMGIAVMASCGGGSGGGGGLPVATVGLIYKLINNGMIAGLFPALQAMLDKMNTNCPFTTAAAVDLSGLTGTCAVDGVETSGTWALSGTVTCTHEGTADGMLFTITAMDAALTVTDCASIVNADANGDGTDEAVNVKLTGAADPFAFAANSTILAVLTDPPVVTLNGSADMTYTNIQLGGDVTATGTYVQGLNFDNMIITAGGEPTCDMNTFTATQSGESGTCTIQTDCGSCI